MRVNVLRTLFLLINCIHNYRFEENETKNASASTKIAKETPEIDQTKCPMENFNGLHFPETNPGVWATSTNLCITDTYLPILRECLSDGNWGAIINSNCSKNYPLSDTTKSLTKHEKQLHVDSHSRVLFNLDAIIKNAENNMQPLDIYLASQILDSISINARGDVGKNFTKIVENLMNLNRTRLKQSQYRLNSTDRILHSLDRFTLRSNFSYTSPHLLVAPGDRLKNLTVVIKKYGRYEIVSWDSLEHDWNASAAKFVVAVHVPQEYSMGQPYFITVFHTDSLFNGKSRKIQTPIVNILLASADGGRNSARTSKIAIWFNGVRAKNNRIMRCNHWNYGNDHEKAIFGEWTLDSNATKSVRRLIKCEFNHTTHFAVLEGKIRHNTALQLILFFATILSIIGLCVIIVTAIVFKKWRQKPTTRIVLNISACLLMFIILFIVGELTKAGRWCFICSLLLHYFLLTHSCWTLVVSYSNYRRLVLVLAGNADNTLLKYCLFSWGSPVIVVGMTVAISRDSYDKIFEGDDFCRPAGLYFQLSVLLPVIVIVFINLIVYILVIRQVTKTFTIGDYVVKKSYAPYKSIILFFFMMGIMWIFGVISYFTKNVVILYIFCTLAAFQGFVMFVFYVLDSGNVRAMWKTQFGSVMCWAGNKFQKSNTHNTDNSSY